MKWQPIATAPTDGTFIIVRGSFDGQGKTYMMAAAAAYIGGVWFRDNNGYGFTVQCFPTEWVAMPKEAGEERPQFYSYRCELAPACLHLGHPVPHGGGHEDLAEEIRKGPQPQGGRP